MTQTNFFTPINLFIATLCFLTKRASCNSTPDSSYIDCRRPRNCSDGQDIHFPFFFQDPTPQNYICGYPGFNLSCNSKGNPFLTTPNNDYIVRQIFYPNQSLRVSNAAVFDTSTTCIPPISNVSLLDGRFRLFNSNGPDLFLLYNCNTSLIKYKVDCFGETKTNWTLAIFEDDPLLGYAAGQCLNGVAAPVVADGGGVDAIEMLERGFMMNWTASNCSICEASGGRCGFNLTTYHFKCFCPDRPHAWHCTESTDGPVCAPIQLGSGEVNQTIESIDYKKKLKDGFTLKWVGLQYDCEACQRSGGGCGFDTDRSTCYCPDGSSQANSCSDVAHLGNGKLGSGAILALGVSGAVLGALMFIAFVFRKSIISGLIFFCWRKVRAENGSIEDFLKHYGPLAQKRYTYSEVKKITKSFKEKLGRGGYGEVFKGNLADGSLVAVKILEKSKTNGEDFINEVASIGRTSHVNIVTLMGFCFEGSKRALIYEFMSGGSLEKYIYEESYSNDDRQLGWETLLDIAIGIARGLEYLHRGCNTRILHFDIKPHNILLDENLCPKVSDFGLAKICPQRESIISIVGARGTAGYIAPEVFCRNFGGVSHKSDVYSYGTMVFEMVGGRKNIRVEVENSSEIYFPHWIHKRLELGEDLGLCGIRNVDERQIAKKMILVSLWCIQTHPSDRPAMGRVVEMLQGSLESISIPPKPYLSSPSGSPKISVSSSPSTSILAGQISEQVIKEVMG